MGDAEHRDKRRYSVRLIVKLAVTSVEAMRQHNKPMLAIWISKATGLPIEEVYLELVEAEAAGLVRTTSRIREAPYSFEWEMVNDSPADTRQQRLDRPAPCPCRTWSPKNEDAGC